MKILMGKKATQDYLNKIRTNSYSSISSDGNGYFSKTYKLEQYIGKIIELTKKKGDDFLVEISSKIDGIPFGGIKVQKNILDESVSQISDKEKKVILNTIERVKLFQSKTLSKSWFDEEKGYERELKYCENQRTPFVDEMKGDQRLSHIIFRNGVLYVEKSKTVLQKLLSLYHPHRDKIFYEHQPEVVAADEIEILEMEADAIYLLEWSM